MKIFLLGLMLVAWGFGAAQDAIQHTVNGHTHTAGRFPETRERVLGDRVWHRLDDQGFTRTGPLLAKSALEEKGISCESTTIDEKQLIKALCIVAMCGVEPQDICYAIRWPLAQKKLHNQGVNEVQLREVESLLDKVRNFDYGYDLKEVCDSIGDKVAELCVSISDGIVQPYEAEKIWNEKIQPMLNRAR